MGLLDRFSRRIRFPDFPVEVYGKLPCHKEYLSVGSSQLFGELKRMLDKGFERRISDHRPPPHVLPDRRFYLSIEAREDLLGCVFESSDGQRHFPFIMAVALPGRLLRRPFPIAWQVCARVWDYLERYFHDLYRQPDAASVYARVRGVVHAPEPLTPVEWPVTEQPIHPDPVGNGLMRVEVDRESGTAPRLALAELPRWLVWPAHGWQSMIDGVGEAFLGRRGLEDVTVDQFRQDAVQTESRDIDLDDTLPDPSPPIFEERKPEHDEKPMFLPPDPLSRDREET
jgi:hypothetical protein